ncbi:MAG: hypothetical protein P0116_14595 [Candidatus Nitrosocosmicus sp.]|nr:hypothetical protein [Candidatus Nitrosocosmicus sp.]
MTFAGGKHKKSNDAAQNMTQIQGIDQSLIVDSGNNTVALEKNIGLLFNLNDRNNALGQEQVGNRRIEL